MYYNFILKPDIIQLFFIKKELQRNSRKFIL